MTNNEILTVKGLVLRIERGSIHDGEGFRTVVFLKGCPLRCLWCSTPESQSFHTEETESNTYGQYMTVEEVMKEVRKDSTFFFHSGGGVTLSGGEILAQPDFTRALLMSAVDECIDTAIETSFFASWDTISSVLEYVNTAYVDLKLIDKKKHEVYCGADNGLILDNLIKTNNSDHLFKLIVRVPIIPGINDSPEELHAVGEFCKELKKLHHVQLLPYHRLGTDTYKKLKREYKLDGVPSPTKEHMNKCCELIGKYVKCTN